MPEHATKGLSLDRALEQYDSKFRFVLLASSRAEQVVRGARPKIEAATRKPTRIAMEELRQGLVEWSHGRPAPVGPGEGGDAAGAAPAEGAQPAEQ
jgi:DNA-directed RNA polymerase subunit omega